MSRNLHARAYRNLFVQMTEMLLKSPKSTFGFAATPPLALPQYQTLSFAAISDSVQVCASKNVQLEFYRPCHATCSINYRATKYNHCNDELLADLVETISHELGELDLKRNPSEEDIEVEEIRTCYKSEIAPVPSERFAYVDGELIVAASVK
eukprot:5661594-Amphidinium_carterae.2